MSRTPLKGVTATDYAWTILAEGAVLGISIITLRLSTATLGEMGFGEFSIVRRVVALVAYTMLCGLGIGLPRTLALGGHREADKPALLQSALAIVAVPWLVFSACVLTHQELAAKILLGQRDLKNLIYALDALIGVTVLHVVVWGYFRGTMRLQAANSMQFLNGGIIPLVAIWIGKGSVHRVLWLTASLQLATSSVFTVIGTDALAGAPRLGSITRHAKELVGYGLMRVPGEFALFGLFSIPTVLVSRHSGVQEAGMFSLGLSLVQIVNGLFSGAGTVMLPHVSRLWSAGDKTTAARTVRYLLVAFVAAAVAIVTICQCSLRFVIERWFGRGYTPAVGLTRTLIFAAIPYAVYVVLRNALDGVSCWPHNSINLSLSLTIQLIVIVIMPGDTSTARAVLISFLVLAALSGMSWLFETRKPAFPRNRLHYAQQ